MSNKAAAGPSPTSCFTITTFWGATFHALSPAHTGTHTPLSQAARACPKARLRPWSFSEGLWPPQMKDEKELLEVTGIAQGKDKVAGDHTWDPNIRIHEDLMEVLGALLVLTQISNFT